MSDYTSSCWSHKFFRFMKSIIADSSNLSLVTLHMKSLSDYRMLMLKTPDRFLCRTWPHSFIAFEELESPNVFQTPNRNETLTNPHNVTYLII